MDGMPKRKDAPEILVLDDIPINNEIMADIIESMGCKPYCATSVQEALEIMKDVNPQLILSDYAMPGMDGIEFCRLLKSKPRTREIPFVLVTAEDSGANKQAAYEAGAVDFMAKPYDRIEVIMRVNNHLNTYRVMQELENYNRSMHKMVTEQQRIAETERENLLLALCKLVEKGEQIRNGGHNERVGCNSHLLAQCLQLTAGYEKLISDEFIRVIEIAARLHDIGNIVIPEASRHQEEQSDGHALSAIRMHTEEGAGILEEINDGKRPSHFLNMAIDIARFHHAHWDGSGYPDNVKGKEIPLAARIVSVVNDFDILICGDGQKEPLSPEESLRVINERSAKRYDPDIIEIFNKVWKRMKTDNIGKDDTV